MPLLQISVFLENSPGRLFEVTRVFGEAGINLNALSLAEASGFGVLRLLVSDTQKARRISMEHHWPAKIDEVCAARISNTPGSLADLLGELHKRGVSIEYMYAFAGSDSQEAVMIFGFQHLEEGISALRGCGADILNTASFGSLEGDSN